MNNLGAHLLLTLVFAILAVPSSAVGQTHRERLQAADVDAYVLLEVLGPTPRYVVDTDDGRWGKPVGGNPVDLSVARRSYDIRIPLVSPFLYKISVDNQVVVDPLAEALRGFASSASAAIPLMAGGASLEPTLSADGSMSVAPVGIPGHLRELRFVSLPLITMALAVRSDTLAWRCLGDEPGENLIRAVLDADRRLFQRSSRATDTHGAYTDSIAVAVRRMAETPTDLAALDVTIERIENGLSNAHRANDAAQGDVGSAVGALAEVATGPGCGAVRDLVVGTVEAFLPIARSQIDARRTALISIRTVFDRGKELRSELRAGEDGQRIVATVAPPTDSVITTTVTFTPITLKMAADGSGLEQVLGTPREFRLRSFQNRLFLAEFGPAIAYTTLSYPQFGTVEVDGRTVIGASDPKEEQALPLAMLNLVADVWDRSVQPLMQVGLSTAENRPLVAVGGGVRLWDINASLTAGAVWSWVPRLQGAELGDPVSGTAELADLVRPAFRETPGLYLALTVIP